MNLSAKSEKEIIVLLSGVIEKYEEEKKDVGQQIHGDISALLSLLNMSLDKYARKTGNSEVLQDVFLLLDESITKLQTLSSELYPSLLKMYGLIKTLENYNQKQAHLKNVTINFENLCAFDKVPLEFKDKLNIFRMYSGFMKYFFDTLGSNELKVSISNDVNYITIEFSNNVPTSFINENMVITKALRTSLQLIEVLILVLNGKIHDRSDFITTIEVSIPFYTLIKE